MDILGTDKLPERLGQALAQALANAITQLESLLDGKEVHVKLWIEDKPKKETLTS